MSESTVAKDKMESAVDPVIGSIYTPGASVAAKFEKEAGTDNRGTRVKITDKEKTAFFEAIVSDQPYSETVELFGGQMKVLFRDKTSSEMEAQAEFLIEEDPTIVLDMSRLYTRFSLASGMSSITIRGKVTSYELSEAEKSGKTSLEQIKLRMEKISGFPRSKYMALVEALGVFENKVSELTRLASKADFFSETPGDISV
jgi:hypothetical protein